MLYFVRNIRFRYIAIAVLLPLLSSIVSAIGPTGRSANYEDAITSARVAGKDIAVFIHGSNWCPVGEVVKKKVWDTTTLPTALKGGFILVSIDHPDNAPKNPEYEKLKKKNSKFNCRTNIYPAVFLLDKDARLYGQINGIQHDVNSSDLAEQMLKIHEKRKQRDSYWQKAESSTGIEKAELFGKGLDAIGVGLGHKGVYKPILEQIKKADPDDKSYYARKYTFNAGTYKNEALKLAGEKEFDQAIELLDSQIVHPGNKLLTSEQIQQIHMAKFHVYKSWPDHEEMRFDVCMDIIKLDPDTNLAVGAQGYYLYHQGPVTIRHGWQPRHIKNTNTSLMLGSKADSIRRYFPQSGSYDVILQFSRGDTLTVSSITLYVDGRQVDIDNHKQDASREAPKCIYTLNIPNISPTQSVQLKISCRSKGDKGSSGRIRIEPSEHTGSITVSPAVKQELAKLKDDLASQLKAYDDKLRKLPWKERFKKNALDQTYTNMLLQHELLRICTTDDLARLLSDSKGKQFFNILSEDSQWLEMLLCSGPFNNRGKPVAPHLVIEVLSEIYNSDPSLKDNRLYKILATAVAIETGTFDDPRIGVDRYNYYVESHKQSKLHPIFDKLETWEMRFVVNTGGKDDGSLRYLRDNYILPVNRYFGICWACPYRGYNVFGDTVQGPMYYVPWQNTMPRWQMIDINGGVCGSLSHFGTICAQAHGVPATAMGEPGHCAYTVRRKRGEWVPCYSLSGKRGVKHSFYRGTWQHINLMEEIFGDRKALLQASIHSFQGQLYRSDRVSPQVTAAYDLALDAHPIHFGIWRDYINMLNTDPATNYKQWVNLTKDIVRTLYQYPEPAWQLIAIYDKNATKGLKPAGVASFYNTFHLGVSKTDQKQAPNDWGFANILKHQAKSLGNNTNIQMMMFRKLMLVYLSSERYLPAVISWGKDNFSKKTGMVQQYCKAISAVLVSKTNKLTDAMRRSICTQGIEAAVKSGDIQAYRFMLQAASKQFNLNDPKERALNADQLKKYPQPPKPAGKLLSAKGLLITSSTSKHDKPLAHYGVLTEQGGFFHTNKEKKPWAIVQLPASASISEIVIVNRFEGGKERQSPLSVSVSDDQKNWTEVFATDEVKDYWTIPLKGKSVHGKFVRVQADHGESSDYFHLRNILVYGG